MHDFVCEHRVVPMPGEAIAGYSHANLSHIHGCKKNKRSNSPISIPISKNKRACQRQFPGHGQSLKLSFPSIHEAHSLTHSLTLTLTHSLTLTLTPSLTSSLLSLLSHSLILSFSHSLSCCIFYHVQKPMIDSKNGSSSHARRGSGELFAKLPLKIWKLCSAATTISQLVRTQNDDGGGDGKKKSRLGTSSAATPWPHYPPVACTDHLK